MRELQADGIAAGMVYNAADIAGDTHLLARNWLQHVDDRRLPGLPFRLARGGGAVRPAGPALGNAHGACFGKPGLPVPAIRPANLRTPYALQPLSHCLMRNSIS